MSLYLLDTNIVSDMIRNPHGNIFRHIEHVGQHTVATSIIVASELRLGVERRPSMRLIEQMEKVMATISVLPFDVDADVHYGRLRADLQRKGTPISSNDMLIAAHALALDATLVTDNVCEFARVDGLVIENWLRS